MRAVVTYPHFTNVRVVRYRYTVPYRREQQALQSTADLNVLTNYLLGVVISTPYHTSSTPTLMLAVHPIVALLAVHHV